MISSEDNELLAMLAEEASEIVKACTKIIRHGWDSYNPELSAQDRVTNEQHLRQELADLAAVVAMMDMSSDLSAKSHVIDRKLKYTKYQPRNRVS